MIGLDTNILTRYYVEDESDKESTKQRELARTLIESGKALMVSKTVLLEFEWVLRGYYELRPTEVRKILRHLLAMPQVLIEDRSAVEYALVNAESGLDFADALHHASYQRCDSIASFDDRKFARRVKKLGMLPKVIVPIQTSR
jgi:predicted nucleic-acid-binding protein